MRKNILRYLFYILSIMVVAIILIFGCGRLSEYITNLENEKYRVSYINGVRGVSSPWYDNGFHVVDENIIQELDRIEENEKNVISIGSSLSIISFDKETGKLPNDYEYHFLVCGNGTWKSDRILYNLANVSGVSHSDDIIKLEISYSTFRDPYTTITETTLNKWKKYSVDAETGEVSKNTWVLEPLYAINEELIKIQNVWELGNDYIKQLSAAKGTKQEESIIPGNFRNNYFDYDAVADSCRIDDEMKDYMADFLMEIDSNNNLIVELSPLPWGLRETKYGSEYNAYIENELIPYLNDNNIQFFDYRDMFSDEEFCDGVHLGYKASILYTQRINEDIGSVISNR